MSVPTSDNATNSASVLLLVTLNGTPVIWKTSKQSIVTKTSTEVELVALSDGGTDILWARNLLTDQRYNLGAVAVGEDNQSVEKHRIKSSELKMMYVPTDMMLADFMTKPLTGKQFLYLQGRSLLSPIPKECKLPRGVLVRADFGSFWN